MPTNKALAFGLVTVSGIMVYSGIKGLSVADTLAGAVGASLNPKGGDPLEVNTPTGNVDVAPNPGLGKSGSSGNANIDAAYREAQQIDADPVNHAYKWGGGHQNFNGPYDCSGADSAVLHAGGMLAQPLVSAGLMKWGAAGKGRHMTVYANPTHAFMVFDMDADGRNLEHFGTGMWGNKIAGAGFKPVLHPTVGFTARHWPSDS